MKTHQLILLTTVLFITLFYGEIPGINFGILGIAYAFLSLYQTPEINRSREYFLLFGATILSSFAFAYYGDPASFFALVMSGFLLAFKSKNRDLKAILVIPVFALNFITFIYRFFQFEEWLPKRNTSGTLQKIISVILIPTFFILIFFAVYSAGSSHFSSVFKDFEFDFNVWEFIVMTFLGFFLAFNFWNFKAYDFIFHQNHFLKNDFLNEEKIQKKTFSFLDIEAERKSGIISLVALNILLVIFIITFNYEQFIEIPKTPNQLSAETHERVNAVVLSIIMAVFVILFYFKGSFNFDKKAKSLKIAAQIWLFLNAVLVISAAAKNSEYILNFGLTYKRLGVYAFLILSLIGLIIAFYKIEKKKTNAFLFNHMIWYFYGTVLVCSFFNWGAMATSYNIKVGKGDYDFLSTFDFNHKILEKKYPEKVDLNFREKDSDYGTFLSRKLYYETLKSH